MSNQSARKAMNQFLAQVENERELRGWSVAKLSRLAFGNNVTYSLQINGDRGMSATSMSRLAQALGMILEIKLGGTVNEQS